MKYSDDPDAYRAALEAKLKPDRIRATLAFAGLYQITHELIKRSVLTDVRKFFCTGVDESGKAYPDAHYATDVLAKDPSEFRASLLWLVDMDAITLAQADRLDAVYAHRHDLTHELIKYIVDPTSEPDIQLMVDAVVILKAIQRFWTEVESGIGTFDQHGDIDLDDVVPLSLIVLQMCIDAYTAGLTG